MATNIPSLDVHNIPEPTSSQSSPAHGSQKLGKDEFLKLLMTQLSHQDPTAPTDSQAFVTQLAQFTTLELMQSSNSSLDNLLLAQTASQQIQTVNMVGKDVLYRTDSVALTPGTDATAYATLAAPAANVTAVVTDGNGRDVRTIRFDPGDQTDLKVTWNGRDDVGNDLPAGNYKIRVTAADKTGKSVSVDQRGYGRVSGVAFTNGSPELELGDVHIHLSDVVEIKERTAP